MNNEEKIIKLLENNHRILMAIIEHLTKPVNVTPNPKCLLSPFEGLDSDK